jgi:hypothetical protein
MSPLEAEKAWIDNNPKFYDGPMHQEAVKRNIEKRYAINEFDTRITKFTNLRVKDPIKSSILSFIKTFRSSL